MWVGDSSGNNVGTWMTATGVKKVDGNCGGKTAFEQLIRLCIYCPEGMGVRNGRLEGGDDDV